MLKVPVNLYKILVLGMSVSPRPMLSIGFPVFPSASVVWECGIWTPDGHGTLDILQSCLITVFFVQLVGVILEYTGGKGRAFYLPHKESTMDAFHHLLLPGSSHRNSCRAMEISLLVRGRIPSTCQQWESALQASNPSENVTRFENLPWTMRHAFFADMGGLLLDYPDFTPFPIDGHQLNYPEEKKYIDYPDVRENAVRDKNKADGFAHALTLIQIGSSYNVLVAAFSILPSQHSSYRPSPSYSAP